MIGVLLVLAGIISAYVWLYRKAFWIAGLGTILTASALIMITGLNNTAYYPSISDIQSSLTIMNSSSSYYTLVVISYATLLAPVVIGYVAYVWNTIRDDGISQKFVKENLGDLY